MPSRAGVPNKNKQALLKLLELRYPGYHPVVEMAVIAHDESLDINTRLNAHKEVAQYVAPKQKAVDVALTGSDGGSIQMEIIKRVVSATD